ncbi:2-hydroxyisoflavanone dehydratase-like [Gastrolobium bilobum]|uniref:2-hydroxyisoflavanone dehydratase-like n=1 Tax=Gastrolobium bilobum TaxID=150636 RepID=UPI002AB14BDD|nr:2-hydroxyisoflavanone dehydratase-like [Gastrolobium bilobum]
MASTTPPTITTTIIKEIVSDMGTLIRFFNDGTLERPLQSPFVPPMLNEPQTGLSSKDIVISHNPTISARLYLPNLPNSKEQCQAEKVPILVYFHGGGFLIESPFSQLYHGHFRTFVPHANVIVVSVEYRLAPEHSLPACYDDCWAALKWVSSHSTKSPSNTESWLVDHGDFNRIFIGGDSAGGNIAHNIAMRAGTESLPGDVKILGAILSHPYFYSSSPIGSEPVTEHEKNFCYTIWDLVYPSAPGGIDNHVVNPVGAGAPSLGGLGCCRIIVCVAGKDRLRDRGVWYYEAVKKSGWQGKLELFEEKDEGHVYHLFDPDCENTNKFIKRLASFLQE